MIDAEGYLRITDRKKHLFVSSGGKNIAPQPIENALKLDKYVSQACVYGDRKPYLTALIVVGGCTLAVIQVCHYDLVFSNNTPTGGDMGAHVMAPAYLRDSLLPHFQLTGWTQYWYNGFPLYRFYMVVPALMIVALNVIFPYGIAFKIVACLGIVIRSHQLITDVALLTGFAAAFYGLALALRHDASANPHGVPGRSVSLLSPFSDSSPVGCSQHGGSQPHPGRSRWARPRSPAWHCGSGSTARSSGRPTPTRGSSA